MSTEVARGNELRTCGADQDQGISRHLKAQYHRTAVVPAIVKVICYHHELPDQGKIPTSRERSAVSDVYLMTTHYLILPLIAWPVCKDHCNGIEQHRIAQGEIER